MYATDIDKKSQANVLINDRLQACISDFGLSVIIEDLRDVSDPLGGAYPSSVLGGAVRWAAPELFSIDDVNSEPGIGGPQLTASCDIYSMGCIALEVCISIFLKQISSLCLYL